MIWVCTVCLGLFGRQLVFEISKHYWVSALMLKPSFWWFWALYFFILKMLPAFYIDLLHMFQVQFRLVFIIEANTMNPDHTAPREQSELGPFCLKFRLSKNISRWESRKEMVWLEGNLLMLCFPSLPYTYSKSCISSYTRIVCTP